MERAESNLRPFFVYAPNVVARRCCKADGRGSPQDRGKARNWHNARSKQPYRPSMLIATLARVYLKMKV